MNTISFNSKYLLHCALVMVLTSTRLYAPNPVYLSKIEAKYAQNMLPAGDSLTILPPPTMRPSRSTPRSIRAGAGAASAKLAIPIAASEAIHADMVMIEPAASSLLPEQKASPTLELTSGKPIVANRTELTDKTVVIKPAKPKSW